MCLKQIQDQIIFTNSKYPTSFEKVVSSGMFSSYFYAPDIFMFSTGSQEYLTVGLLHGN